MARPIEAFMQEHTSEVRVQCLAGDRRISWESAPLDAETALIMYRKMRDAARGLREGLAASGVDMDMEDAAA